MAVAGSGQDGAEGNGLAAAEAAAGGVMLEWQEETDAEAVGVG